MEWKPRACLDHPLHLATQPNTNTPSKISYLYANTKIPVSVGLHFIQKTGVETPFPNLNLLRISLSSLEDDEDDEFIWLHI